MTRNVTIAIAVFALAGTAGCEAGRQKSVYWPNVVNAPSLADRGDVHVSAHGTLVDWQANAAYAVLPHLSVRGQVDAHPGVLITGDVGIGVFGGVGNAESGHVKEGWRWGIAADVGTGENSTYTASNTAVLGQEGVWEKSEFSTQFSRASVQGDLTLVREKYQFVAVLRHTRIRGRIHEKDFRKESGGSLETEERTVDIDWYGLEPAIIFRPRLAGEVYWELQLGTSSPQGRHAEEFANNGLLWPLIVVLGVGANF